jgi:hypothetical protein
LFEEFQGRGSGFRDSHRHCWFLEHTAVLQLIFGRGLRGGVGVPGTARWAPVRSRFLFRSTGTTQSCVLPAMGARRGGHWLFPTLQPATHRDRGDCRGSPPQEWSDRRGVELLEP